MTTFYRREPASEELMLECKSKQPGSLCKMLSRIYFKTEDPEIKKICRIAVTAAKAMSRRLKEYQRAT